MITKCYFIACISLIQIKDEFINRIIIISFVIITIIIIIIIIFIFIFIFIFI